jgi:hypothetical protein
MDDQEVQDISVTRSNSSAHFDAGHPYHTRLPFFVDDFVGMDAGGRTRTHRPFAGMFQTPAHPTEYVNRDCARGEDHNHRYRRRHRDHSISVADESPSKVFPFADVYDDDN